MEDYTRELMDLKTLVARTLEKKGVLAKIRAELRSTVFEAIEEEDRALENEDGISPALLGSCNDQAKQLHASPSGKLLTALICEYLEWAQLGHTLKVYLPECNLPKGFWKSELREKFGAKYDAESSKDEETGPLLMEIVETYLKYEDFYANGSENNLVCIELSMLEPLKLCGQPRKYRYVEVVRAAKERSIEVVLAAKERSVEAVQASKEVQEQNAFENLPKGSARRSTAAASTSSADDCIGVERHMSRLSSSHAGSLLPLGRHAQGTQSSAVSVRNSGLGNVSDRVNDGHRKEDHGWRYDDQQHSDNVIRTSNAFENIQLDRKARCLTSSWRNVDDGIAEDDSRSERDTF